MKPEVGSATGADLEINAGTDKVEGLVEVNVLQILEYHQTW